MRFKEFMQREWGGMFWGPDESAPPMFNKKPSDGQPGKETAVPGKPKTGTAAGPAGGGAPPPGAPMMRKGMKKK